MPCIPSQLFRFRCQRRKIEWIDARCSKLEDFPMREIEKCRATLRELNLSSNCIEFVPKDLYTFDKMEFLDLSGNCVRRLPEGISQLTALEELILNGNYLERLPDDLSSCPNLSLLSLSANDFQRLPPVISQIESLTTLNIASVDLLELPNDFSRLQNLRNLDIRDNQLGSFPYVLCQLANLVTLDIGNNEIPYIPREISLLTNLRELSIDENEIDVIPEEVVAGCFKLEVLEISKNRISEIPKEIGDLESLVELRCSRNRLKEFPNSLGRLKNLKILHSQENAIEHLNPSIGGCTSLEELDLSDNFLVEVPSAVGNLQVLHSLNLDCNELLELPTTIGDCHSLRVLSLRQNNLRELPMDVGRLEKLKVLDVCFNRLSHLPYTLKVNLPSLEAVWLTLNQRPIPAFSETDDCKTGIKVLVSHHLPQSRAKKIVEGSAPPTSKVSTPSKVKFVDSPNPSSKATPFIRNPTLRQGTPLPIKSLISRLSNQESTASESGIASTSTESEAFFGSQCQRLVCGLERSGKDEWGFSFIGGSDEKRPIRVVNVMVGGCAYETGVRIGDRILSVNGVDFSNIKHCEAIEYFVNASVDSPMVMEIERYDSPSISSQSSTYDDDCSASTNPESNTDPVAHSLTDLDDIPMIDYEEDEEFSTRKSLLASPALRHNSPAILA
ncbi:hypothetical protein L596_014845 [Steinernema carpocapsae]|uniref:PDZ domain-containing protein n=1 Tax=Steinernema carpocapsae TaxID=34508 RepID=A0A4U5NE29_STECR|nr:hypothetical protein L596_014845 [Steinernema carpocapsae]